MEKVFITGIHSYIGNELERYLTQPSFQQDFQITKSSLREVDVEKLDLSEYDTIVHVAGIAHVDMGTVTEEFQKKYKQINCDLTGKLAKQAKSQGVKQFIYISSMIVYGDSNPPGTRKVITKETVPVPGSVYGGSKLDAEKEILKLNSESFCITIVRPPMVYGKNSKGNYPKLSKLSRYLLFFPKIENKRSMIYIENLCELFRLLIRNRKAGIFCPDNEEAISTYDMVREIGKAHGRNIIGIRFLNPLIYFVSNYSPMITKVFGNMEYDRTLTYCEGLEYRIVNFEDSIMKTEREQV